MEVKPTIPALRGNLNPLSSLKPLTRCQDLLKLRVCFFFFVSSQKELNVRQSGRQTVSLWASALVRDISGQVSRPCLEDWEGFIFVNKSGQRRSPPSSSLADFKAYISSSSSDPRGSSPDCHGTVQITRTVSTRMAALKHGNASAFGTPSPPTYISVLATRRNATLQELLTPWLHGTGFKNPESYVLCFNYLGLWLECS